MRSKYEVYYNSVFGIEATIPAGVKVIEATNLPKAWGKPRYWVEPWEGMTEAEAEWQKAYGFVLMADEVEEG